MRALIIVFLVSATLYLLLVAALYATQRRQIYFPVPETRNRARESFRLLVAGSSLKIWRLHPQAQPPGRPALIYFGGNAENVADNFAEFDRLFAGYTVYLANYRGYGGSSGQPSENALLTDAVSLFDAVEAEHPAIAVIGRSLGSAVAIHLAARRPVTRLLLITPFASLTGVARAHYFYLPVSRLLKDRYENLAKIPAITAPVLMLLAENDEIIPRRESDRLRRAFTGHPCETVTIPGAGHNDLDRHPLYRQTIKQFIATWENEE